MTLERKDLVEVSSNWAKENTLQKLLESSDDVAEILKRFASAKTGAEKINLDNLRRADREAEKFADALTEAEQGLLKNLESYE